MTNIVSRSGRYSRAVVREQLATVSSYAPRPSVRDRFFAYGPSPIRVMLVGNGIALGYGVSQRSDTLDGHIGRRLAGATHRGVLVNNHTDDSSKLEQQALSVVAGMNLQTEDIVVWCPSYSEVLERWRPGYWRETMTTFLDHVAPSVTVVLVEVPAIESDEFDPRHLNTSIRRINQALTVSSRNRPNVATYAPPAVQFVIGRDSLYDAAYYEAVGKEVADIVLAQRFESGARDGDAPAAPSVVQLLKAQALV